jgi:hypothetical protein
MGACRSPEPFIGRSPAAGYSDAPYDVKELSISARVADDAGPPAELLQELIEDAARAGETLHADLDRARDLDAKTLDTAGHLHEGLLLGVKMLKALEAQVARAEEAVHALEVLEQSIEQRVVGRDAEAIADKRR